MPIKYTIDKKNKVIVETWSETITIEEFKQTKEKEFSDPDFNPNFQILSDLRRNNQKIDETIIIGIAEFLRLHPEKINNRKSAIIANNPQTVAGSIIFNTNIEDLTLNTRIFTTIEAALEWLNN